MGAAVAVTLHRVWGPVSIVLLVLGLLFWLVVGLLRGHAADVGVYSVSIMLLGFGLGGLWASMHMGERQDEFQS